MVEEEESFRSRFPADVRFLDEVGAKKSFPVKVTDDVDGVFESSI